MNEERQKQKNPKCKEKRDPNCLILGCCISDFCYGSGESGVDAVYSDENIWLVQKMMGLLYDVDVITVNYHLEETFSVSELEGNSVIRNYRITTVDGKNYNTKHCNLSASGDKIAYKSLLICTLSPHIN